METDVERGSADGLESTPSPTRVLPFLSHAGNQRALTNWFEQRDQYEVVGTDRAALSDADADIIILDERSLRTAAAELRERKTAADAIVPVLLVTSDTVAERLDTQTSAAPPVSELVDEILTTPIKYAELRSRIDALARIRAQSVALEAKTEQLLLLNRITRHDIRNEMNIVGGWTEQLAAHTDGAGDEIRQRILDGTHHVVDLTKAVQEFVETLQTDGEPNLQAMDLAGVLGGELSKRRAAHEDATFDLDGEIPPVCVRANHLLASVFRNVLNNAVEHNDSDTPRVEIDVTDSDETVTVTMTDNGPGIPPDRRDAVLGRTEQGLAHPAAGLGLYLVDTLVAQYGGTVRIETGESGGTALTVELRKALPAEADDR